MEDQEKVLKRQDGAMAFCYTEENGKRSDLRFRTGAGGGRPQNWGVQLWYGLFHLSVAFLAFLKNGAMVAILSSLAHPEGGSIDCELQRILTRRKCGTNILMEVVISPLRKSNLRR